MAHTLLFGTFRYLLFNEKDAILLRDLTCKGHTQIRKPKHVATIG